MDLLSNFLSSGHHFSASSNLQKFRYSMLNSLLLIAALFTLLNYCASVLNLVIFPPVYDITLLFYALSCFLAIHLLRLKNKGVASS